MNRSWFSDELGIFCPVLERRLAPTDTPSCGLPKDPVPASFLPGGGNLGDSRANALNKCIMKYFKALWAKNSKNSRTE